MNITQHSPYISIKKLEKTTLPDFAVLTGVNGSGKTHFLKAI
jgi:recombinational DNA repair ATPase RecF